MIVVIVGMLLFIVSHSVMADKRVKQAFRNRFGERAYHGLYRILYNIVAGVILGLVGAYVWAFGLVIWVAPDWLEIPFLLIQIVGLIGVAVALLQTDIGEFLGITQAYQYFSRKQLPLPEQPLVTNGLYRLVRHPLYLFSLMVIWPVTAMTDLYLAFAIFTTAYFLIGSWIEERRLAQTFGQEYEDYRNRIAWMIPFLRF